MSNFGKCTEEFKLRLAFSTAEILVRRAHENGMTPAEYFRTILEIHAHGREEVSRIHEEKLNRLLGEGK
ncbi:MAG: hypothetical protein K2Q13_10340 [Nitrosomonas sp.]|uniref:hypothetical protein n=1 Tax=Nitrosomonas sp. TaxID=42353 RepID=UPI0025DD4034|nr:hypothetical protein [Nitrosomonas sp.]MBY0475440.1 hypothetical protein [Nitrosomonas sp.]